MLSLNANWLTAMKKARPEIRVLLNLTTAVGVTHQFLSGLSSIFHKPTSLKDCTAITTEIEIPDRKPQVSSVTANLEMDQKVSDLVVNNYLRGKKADLLIGEASLAEADYEEYITGAVDDAVPINNAKNLRLNIKDVPKYLLDANVAGYWIGQHPLEVAYNILTRAGVPSSQITTADFTPANFTTISHFVISSGYYAGAGQNAVVIGHAPVPTPALFLLGAIAEVLDGMIWIDELGKFRFTRFDAAGSLARTLTDPDDIMELVQVDSVGKLYNRITVESHYYPPTDYFAERYEQNDEDSQANYAWPGESEKIIEYKVQDQWSRSGAHLEVAVDAVATTIKLYGYVHGFAGTRWPGFPAGSQPADAVLSGGRLGYIKIDDEIMECTAVSVNNTQFSRYSQLDFATGNSVVIDVPYHITYTVVRGRKGTSAAAHAIDAQAIDLTLSVYLADSLLTRFCNGAPVIEITTSLRHFDLQLGDLVAVVSSRYRAYGKSALTSSTAWEIIGKDVVIFGDEPHIKFTLAWATDSAAPSPTVQPRSKKPWPWKKARQNEYAMIGSDVGQKHIISGFTVTRIAALQVRVAAGVASGLTGRYETDTSTDKTLTASKDTYIRLDLLTAHILFEEVANGAAEPARLATQIPLAIVVTDGSDVVTITDMRDTRALSSNKVAAEGPQVLLDNPNFELGDVGWATKDGWAIGVGNARDGKRNAYIAAAVGDFFLRNDQIFKVREGEKYYAEAWFKSTGGADGTATVRIQWLDIDKAEISQSTGSGVTATTTYAMDSIKAEAPSGACYARIGVGLNAAGTTGTWYVDDVIGKASVTYHQTNFASTITQGKLFNVSGQIYSKGKF